jgi:hypothetical protein
VKFMLLLVSLKIIVGTKGLVFADPDVKKAEGQVRSCLVSSLVAFRIAAARLRRMVILLQHFNVSDTTNRGILTVPVSRARPKTRTPTAATHTSIGLSWTLMQQL